MTLLRLRDFGKLFVTLSFYLMLCSSTQRDLVAGSAAQKYVTIKNIGIKMCQARCAEQGGCESFQYDIQTLTCRLPSCEMTMFTEESESTFLLKDPTHVLTGACGSKSCRLGSLCVRTRSGKAACVKGGKQFSQERCLQKKRDKNSKDVNNQLHAACCEGDMCQVRNILGEGDVDINSRTGQYNRTPVMVAAREGHVNVLDFLVKNGCDLRNVDANGDNILHRACYGGHIEMVKYVLSHTKLDINSRGVKLMTSLMQAAYFGHTKVFALLAYRGGDVFLTDVDGHNILYVACSRGHIEMVKYVLSQTQLDINSRGHHGRTPLMAAAYYGDYKVFKLLMDRGGDVSLRDAKGDNILHRACSGGHIEMVKYVLSHTKLDINSRGHYGRTPLMAAAYYGDYKVFKLLMDRGGDVSLRDGKGNTILHRACSGGHIEMVKYVLSHTKLDINSRGHYGRTPLMAAAYHGHYKVFKLLVDRGSDVSLKDVYGDDIIHIACSSGHLKLIKFVLSQDTTYINNKRALVDSCK